MVERSSAQVNLSQVSELNSMFATVDAPNYIKKLQRLVNDANSKPTAELLLNHIVTIINQITENVQQAPANQVVLNIAIGGYYQLLYKHGLRDCHFKAVTQQQLAYHDVVGYQMLYSILLAEKSIQLDAKKLKTWCISALKQAVEDNCNSVVVITKVLNLLCRKFPTLEVHLSLEYIYPCLQTGLNGMREEVLLLFGNSCRQPEHAIRYFNWITNLWPWTNRNKFYLLSYILKSYNLDLLLASTQQSKTDFFLGLRLSLSYKNLLPPSQYLVKALSGQDSGDLLQLAVEILTNGTRSEVQNFYAQWFPRISQKDAIFELLRKKPQLAQFLSDYHRMDGSIETHRFVLIFTMFSRQVFMLSRMHFFKISTELIVNFRDLELDTRLLVFKFIVDNLGYFAIQDSMEFIFAFVEENRKVADAQFRNNVLGKVPAVINYTAKMYVRLNSPPEANPLKESIIEFFKRIHEMIALDINAPTYQLQIFALKLLDILVKSLYAKHVTKNTKSCITEYNQQLGIFLQTQQIFDGDLMASQLVTLLNDPNGYEDVLELKTTLIQKLNYANTRESFDHCIRICESCKVDECLLATHFTKVALQSFRETDDGAKAEQLFEYAFNSLNQQLGAFHRDPLWTCKTRNHLFGYLITIHEVVLANAAEVLQFFSSVLSLLTNIVHMVLDKLNLANLRNRSKAVTDTVASFEDIEVSLQILVQESTYVAPDHDESRKFLLMSFWLTLKACCDLATCIGSNMVSAKWLKVDDSSGVAPLEQCLKINTTVLTRCRHKGVIESAGLSIGRLAKAITSKYPTEHECYRLLQDCLALLFDDAKQVSTSRRGAGFSIMLLHLVKNEENQCRPLLRSALSNILNSINAPGSTPKKPFPNCDSMEALTLHYLCVLVKDTELREPMSKYYNEIMMAAIQQIDNSEWTVCNASLQLFGALIPKIVGQKQATEFADPVDWEPTEITYSEIFRKLPKGCEHILNNCGNNSTSTRSIILFLRFLSKVEHLRVASNGNIANQIALLDRFRELMWNLLAHKSEKVRKLAALCLVRAHDMRCDLPSALINISKLVFNVKNENLFQGMLCTLIQGVYKMHYESKHTVPYAEFIAFLSSLKSNLIAKFATNNFKLYTLCSLADLLTLLDFNDEAPIVQSLIHLKANCDCIGYDDWQVKLALLNNSD